MPIPVQCAGCAVKLNAPDAAAGKRLKCPKCGQPVAVPMPAPPPDPVPEPVDLEAAPVRPAPPATEDDRPAPPRKKRAERGDRDDRPPRGEREEREREQAAKPKAGAGTWIVGILGGLLMLGGVGVAAWGLVKEDDPQQAGGPLRPRPNPNPGPFNPGPGPGQPEKPVELGPLTATDLTPHGVHATLDLPAVATFTPESYQRIKLPGRASLSPSSEDLDDKDDYFDKELAKGAVVEKTDTAVWTESRGGFGGGASHHMRAVLPLPDRKLVVKHSFYGTRAEATGVWGVVKSFRQTDAQQKAEKPRREAVAKLKAAEVSVSQGSEGAQVSFTKPTAELLAVLKDIPDLTGVTVYSFGGTTAPELAKAYPALPNLRRLNLPATDEELASVGQCAGLTELILTAHRVTDAGLAPLGNLTKLTTLNLSGARLAGDLPFLKKMPDLQTLNLSNASFSDDALRHVAGLSKLRTLTLSHSTVTDAGVAHLTGLTKLTMVYLDATPITGATLGALAGNPTLSVLNLGESAVTDAGLGKSGRLSAGNVSLRNTRVGDAGLAAVAKWDGVEYLTLDGTSVTDAGLAALVGSKVRSLDLGETAVTDKGVDALAAVAELSSLDLHGCPVGDAALAAALRCPKLSSLNLRNTDLTDAGLAPLARLGKDRYVSVAAYETKVTAAAAKAATKNSVAVNADAPKPARPKTASADPPVPLAKLKPAAPDKLLEDLDDEPVRDDNAPGKPVVAVILARSPPLTDLELAEIRDLKSLRDLTVRSDKVTDGGLAYLSGLSGLESLNLSGRAITGSGLVHLRTLPKLKRLSLPYLDEKRVYSADELRPLGDIKTLESVEIPKAESPRVLFELYGQLPKLARVVLTDNIHPSDLKALPPMPSVQEFRLGSYVNGTLRGWTTVGLAGLKSATVVELRFALDDAAVANLSKATAVSELTVGAGAMTEQGYKTLAGMPELTDLTLRQGHFGGAELAALAAAPKLEELVLEGGTLGDRTLAGLSGAKGLLVLRVKGLPLSDAALDVIAKMPKLEAVQLANTAVTKAAVEKLRKAKPDLDVQFSEVR